MGARKTAKAGASDLVPLNLRVPKPLLEALDEAVDLLNEANPYGLVNRTALVRDLLAQGLQQIRVPHAHRGATNKPAGSAKGKARGKKTKG